MRPTGVLARWGLRLLVGLLVANGLAAAGLLLPASRERARHEEQALDIERRIRSLAREGRTGESLLTAVKEVEEFGRGYPSRRQLVPELARLSDLAHGHALDVAGVDYQPGEIKEAGLLKVAVQMGLQGSYSGIRRFLYDLEGLRRHVVIERLVLRDPKGAAELQVQLQLGLYFQ
jgi:Tfp pilus assembly protein PilO